MVSRSRTNFINYLSLQRFAPATKEAYLFAVKGLAEYYSTGNPELLSNDQIQDYLFYNIQEKKLAWASCNVLFCALKKYYVDYIGRTEINLSIPPRPRSRKLPLLLSKKEVSQLLHVLPFRFMKIRYYGFLANICKKKSILLIRRLIGVYMEARIFIEETLEEKVKRLTGKDITLCPHCKTGRMMYLALLPGLNTS